MSGEATKKVKCTECKINYYPNNFGVNTVKDLKKDPVCSVCGLNRLMMTQQVQQQNIIKRLEKIENKIETGDPQIGASNLEMLEDRITNIEEEIMANDKIILKKEKENTELIQKVKELTTKIDIFEKTKPISTHVVNRLQENNCDNENFILVKNNYKGTLKQIAAVKTANRFLPISDLEEEAVVIGDSQIRGQSHHFVKKNEKSNRCAYVHPKITVKRAIKEIENIKLKSPKSTLIVNVGDSDIYCNKRDSVSHTTLKNQFSQLIDTVK